MPEFVVELDELISRHKQSGTDVGEIIADIEGALAGLKDEQET